MAGMDDNRDTTTAEILSRPYYSRLPLAGKLDLEAQIIRRPSLAYELPADTQIARDLWLCEYYKYLSVAAGRRAELLAETTKHYRRKI